MTSHRTLGFLLASFLVAPGVFAANLLANPGFDGGATGWSLVSEPGRYSSQWRPEDATGDVGSGSVRLTHLGDLVVSYTGAIQCVPVEGGTTYQTEARLRIPAGQAATGSGSLSVFWFGGSACTSFLSGSGVEVFEHDVAGVWAHKTGSVVAPPGARSARLNLRVGVDVAGTTLSVDFDDLVFDDGSDPDPPFATWISSSDLPGFEAQVRVTPSGGGPIQGSRESDCIAETICAFGALAGRAEIFVKVIGPRPNGFLWVQFIRFTPSRVEVWLRQRNTLLVNYYALDAVAPDDGVLRGLEDREAFVP